MKEKEGVVRILIADDHAIFRDGLKALLSGHRGFRVVGEVDDGSGVLKLLENLKPDILLLDLRCRMSAEWMSCGCWRRHKDACGP
jgi:DNA-binding NarL/FixJ family response regulator